MKLKEFFKLNWTVFLVFAAFNLIASIGLLRLGGIGGVHTGSTVFDIFSILNQLKCSQTSASLGCSVSDFFIRIFVPALNLVWQYFLACLTVYIVGKIKKK